MTAPDLNIRELGQRDYVEVWQAMRAFTDARTPHTPDELWLLQHAPVFTLGQSGRPEHVLEAGNIPVLWTDRGGQVTYHGPGQLVLYTLLDLHRRGLGIRQLVSLLEEAVIALLDSYGIGGKTLPGAPGVYVNGSKIASIGLRVHRGRSYHGLSLNVDMDLGPFERIHPCGYRGLRMTQLSDLVNSLNGSNGLAAVAGELLAQMHRLLQWEVLA
jgi:lipoyl(octanoyl) transferase